MKSGESPLLSGLDVLVSDPAQLRGRTLGLLANGASVTGSFVPALRALTGSGLGVKTLFGPEHGFSGAAQDMEAVGAGGPSRVPVVSLYGTTFEELSPRREQLDGLDAVVSDLPDVGSRYYTFVWTTALMMKACAARGIPLWVLDRPNPLGGDILEGNFPDDERLLSFVGLYPTVVRHGLTPGEMARYVNREWGLGCELHVVPMQAGGHPVARRRIAETPAWVLPSPNMPTPDTARVYPGGCLFEGTNLSEGRGTTRPFELVGAPWLDGEAAAEAANSLGAPGVVFHPHTFKPMFQKHAGQLCGGVQLHITDPARYRSYETALRLIQLFRDLDPGMFRWRTERYEYRDDVPAIDLLTGTARFRKLVDERESLDEWIAGFKADEVEFARKRADSLLYRSGAKTLLVVGAHESGKTTIMVRLIEALVAAGHRVATVKHTPHEYETDLPGKDSARHAGAGANPAILVSGRRWARHGSFPSPPSLAELLDAERIDADVVLVEGYRSAPFPKIEVVRSATGRTPQALEDPDVIAVVTDVETAHAASIPRFKFEEIDTILSLVKKSLGLHP